MKRPLLIVAAVSLAWWLFGVSVDGDSGVRVLRWRRFGRCTRVDMIRLHRPMRGRYFFSWLAPHEPGSHQPPREIWEDRNGDGRWDTWIRNPLGPDATPEGSTEYAIDLNGDGRPDDRFATPQGDWEEAARRIEARRGW